MIATEGHTGQLPQRLRRSFRCTLVVASEPLPEDLWRHIGLSDRHTFTDNRNLITYGQRTADGGLGFGGHGHADQPPTGTDQVAFVVAALHRIPEPREHSEVDYVHKAMEQLEKGDAAVPDHFALGTRRLPIRGPERTRLLLSLMVIGNGCDNGYRPIPYLLMPATIGTMRSLAWVTTRRRVF